MKQLEFKKVKGWGGKRRGAGRPNRTSQVSHGKRPKVDFKKPLHITMKLKKNSPNLRTKTTLNDFSASLLEAKKFGLNVLHFSIQTDHVHMIVEAKNNRDLSRGMKSLCGRLGKRLGGVFNGRYHLHVLKSPSEMKNALLYVLLNRAKHKRLLSYRDEFSTAKYCAGLAMLDPENPLLREDLSLQPPPYLSQPRSWLASQSWRGS